MRLITLALATWVAVGPALAKGWKEFSYPGFFFSVWFPADPKIETTAYQAADGQSAEARVYSVTQGGAVFKISVVDLSDATMEESAVIDHAIRTLSERGEIKLNIAARVSRVYGRQLSILGADGSHASVALFFYEGRLYQIEGTSIASGDGTADAIRFQQSLIFTDNGSNAPAGERGPRDRPDRRDRGERGQRRDRRDRAVPQPL